MVASAQARMSSALPSLPRPEGGMRLIPISAPNHACLRTKPTNRKLTPMVVTARKSWRSRSEGAGAVKRGVAQAELPAEAGDHVEAHRQHDVDADDGEHAVGVGAHAVFQASPCGRRMSTAMRNRKAMASRSM